MSYLDDNDPSIEILEEKSKLSEKSDKYLIDNSVISKNFMKLVLDIRRYYKEHKKLSFKQRQVLINSIVYK